MESSNRTDNNSLSEPTIALGGLEEVVRDPVGRSKCSRDCGLRGASNVNEIIEDGRHSAGYELPTGERFLWSMYKRVKGTLLPIQGCGE